MTKASDIQSKVIEFLKKNPDPEDDKFHKFAETIVKEHDIAEEAAYEIIGSLMSGGKSKGKDTKVDPKELAMGIKVEVEHTNNKDIAEKIARDHLSEIPDYYTRLNKMEKEADKPMKKSFIKIYDNMYVMLEKAKYKKRTPDGKGGWKYEYYEPKGSKKISEKDKLKSMSVNEIKSKIKAIGDQQRRLGVNDDNEHDRLEFKKQSFINEIEDREGMAEKKKHKEVAERIANLDTDKNGNIEVQTSHIRSFFDVSPGDFREIAERSGYNVELDFKNDAMFLSKQSPMQKANYKYIKRLPKPNGKGYIYFYNQQQIKDYKEKGIEPGGKKEKDEKKGLLSGIMSFFGFKSEKQAQEKIKETYEAHKEELKGVGISTFAEYMNEYLSNKEKWDKKFAGKSGEKKEKSEKKEEKPEDKKTVMSEKKKPSWNMGLMKKIAGIVGMSDEARGITTLEIEDEKWSQDAGTLEKNRFEQTLKDVRNLPNNKLKKDLIVKMSKIKGGINFGDKNQVWKDIKKVEDKISKFKQQASKDNFETMPEGEGKTGVMSAGINDSEIKKNLDQYSPKMNSAMELMQEYEKAKKDGDVNKMIAIQSLVSEFIEDKSKSREENIEILGKIVENLPTDKQIDDFARGRYSTQSHKKGNQILRDRYEKLSNVKTTSDKGLKKYSITDGDYAGSEFYKGDPKEVAKKNSKPSDIIDSKIMNPERFYADNIVEQGQWTNSRIAIFDKKVADKLNEQSRKKFKDTDFSRKSELQMDQIKPKNLDNYSDATFSYAKGSSDEKGANMIYENQDGEKSMYNASFIDLLQKNFPNGKLMTPKDGGMSPATWVENGEIKAVVMPIMNSEEQFKGMEEVANGLTGKDDFEKQKEKAQSGDSSDPTAEINLQNEDGSYKKRIPYTKIDKKKFKDEKEKKFFDKVKIKDPISSQDDIKPVFKHNPEAQKEGVWTDGKSLILDKQVTDDIYEKHNQNLLLKEIAKGKTYEEAMNVLKDRQDSTYMDYKRIIPKDSDISSKNAQFTGNYDLASNKYGFNKMEYSDGDTTVYMNADNVALMKDRFPNATMHITGQMSPVVFKEGGKIKGLVQPIDQRQIKNLEKLEKARQSANLLLSEFQKAKKMPIGTVNKNGYTKIAEGKWVKKGGKQAPKEEKKPGEKPGDDKKKEEKPKPTDERKEKLKSVLKKVASIFADALSMKDTVPATGQTVEETGENIKKKTEQKKKNPEAVKPEQKKPENTKKPKQENK